MRRLGNHCIALLLLVGLFATAMVEARPQSRFITVGTGGVTGVYYSVGGAICQLVNQHRSRHGLRCSVEATAASEFNLRAVLRDDLDFGLTQSGLQYHAYHGQGAFSSQGPAKELRSLFSLHHELVTIVASKRSGIDKFDALRGKRFNIGVEGSGTRIGALTLIQNMGMGENDFATLAAMKPDAQSDALCTDKIDAFFYMIGHPAQNISDAIQKCDGVIVPLVGPKIDALIRERPYYVRGAIPGGLYPGHPTPVETYGVRGTVVATSKTPVEVVYQLVKSVFDNFEQFTKLHPALADLTPQTMIRDGLTAPLHEGAIKYYKERGWL